jgi:hypothetical protein
MMPIRIQTACWTLAVAFAVLAPATWRSTVDGAERVAPVAVGEKASGSESLRDMLGNARPLSDFEGKAFVLAFVGVDCPLANLYVPRLVEMHETYSDRNVQFLAVYPNRPETLGDIAAHAYERAIPFPVMKDFSALLADELGVTRTPTVCILDEDLNLRYRGRIDDQYAVATRRTAPRHHDLRDALDAVLAGKKLDRPEVAADGCPLNRSAPVARKDTVTYHEHVAPILRAHCVECHREGQIGPMTLVSYDDVVANGESVKEVVEQRRMPPWHADDRFGHFDNDRRIPADQLATIAGWFEQGMPQGDPGAGTPYDASRFANKWTIKPDMVVAMPEPAKVDAGGVMPYQYYLVATNFKEDRWVTASEAIAGNPAVVHHVIVYFAAPSRGSFFDGNGETQILAIGGPGEGVFRAPEGTALRLPKGTELLFELHYQPNGVATTDLTEVGIVFSDKPPKRELRMNMFGTEDLRIPPHAPHHAQRASFEFEKDGQIFAMLPHMHWRGKAYQASIETTDGKTETLLSVPRYDFNWQSFYRFAEPIEAKAGTQVHSVAHWDNSANNLANPDPSIEVHYGLQTSEEMMYGFLTYAYDEPVQESLPPPKPNLFATLMFKGMDKDKSGLIEPDEMPADMRQEMLSDGMQFRSGITPLAFRALVMESHHEH